jgi:hypothetical protein
MSNGSVVSNKTSATAGETVTLTVSPSTGYELDAITVQRSSSSTNVTLSGTGLSRTFTMPAYGVTVEATFKTSVTQALWEQALAVIVAAAYNVPQSAAATEADLAAWLASHINGLLQTANINLTLTAADIWIQSADFAPAAAGANGSFVFFPLPPGVSGSTLISGTIVAGATGNEQLTNDQLKAYAQDGVLYISGLAAGAELRVYNVMGVLVASPNPLQRGIALPARGVYIVTDGKSVVKVVN